MERTDRLIRNCNFLILGQVVTGRTETVEEYLRYRCHKLAVVGLAGIHQHVKGRCNLYKEGKPVIELYPVSFIAKSSSKFHEPFALIHYVIQSFLTFLSVLRFKTRFHIAIGISTFYAFMAILLRHLKFVDYVVYYCLDYYPSKSLINKLFIRLDRFCSRNSDIIWDLTTAISMTRSKTIGASLRPNEIIVPLTYPAKLITVQPIDKIDRWSIAFVGTLEKMQGLQLLIEAMPEILRHVPDAHVKIVGNGPYSTELKSLVKSFGLERHFTFYGFVRSDSEVVRIISNCAIGVAPFTPVPENNAIVADPGKIKFYAFLGLPVIVTRIPSGLLVEKARAGVVVEYEPHSLAEAIVKLLTDDSLLEEYRLNANKFAQLYTSENVFPKAFKATLQIIKSRRRKKGK